MRQLHKMGLKPFWVRDSDRKFIGTKKLGTKFTWADPRSLRLYIDSKQAPEKWQKTKGKGKERVLFDNDRPSLDTLGNPIVVQEGEPDAEPMLLTVEPLPPAIGEPGPSRWRLRDPSWKQIGFNGKPTVLEFFKDRAPQDMFSEQPEPDQEQQEDPGHNAPDNGSSARQTSMTPTRSIKHTPTPKHATTGSENKATAHSTTTSEHRRTTSTKHSSQTPTTLISVTKSSRSSSASKPTRTSPSVAGATEQPFLADIPKTCTQRYLAKHPKDAKDLKKEHHCGRFDPSSKNYKPLKPLPKKHDKGDGEWRCGQTVSSNQPGVDNNFKGLEGGYEKAS